MPFTASHVAAVLPLLRRRPFVPAALVVGAMAPDLPLFLPELPLARAQTHAYANVLTSTALLALVVWASWRWVFARPLHDLIPPRIRRLVPEPPVGLGWTLLPSAYLSVALGILTHLVWDSFTHYEGDGVLASGGVLESEVFGRPLFAWLQHVSTVLGCLAILWWLWRLRSERSAQPPIAPPERAALRERGPRWAHLGTRGRYAVLGLFVVLPALASLPMALDWQEIGKTNALVGVALVGTTVLLAVAVLWSLAWWLVQGVNALVVGAGRAPGGPAPPKR